MLGKGIALVGVVFSFVTAPRPDEAADQRRLDDVLAQVNAHYNEGVVLFCHYMTDSMLGGLLVHMKVDYT